MQEEEESLSICYDKEGRQMCQLEEITFSALYYFIEPQFMLQCDIT